MSATPVIYDVIIAGGGASGILAAARIAAAHPGARILVLEREAVLGGRLRATEPAERRFGYGLNAVSGPLFDFWARTLAHDAPDAPELSALIPHRHQQAGVMQGAKIAATSIDQWNTPKGARLLGGMVAQKQWPDVEAILTPQAGASAADDDDDEEAEAESDDAPVAAAAKSHHFAHYWQLTRKAPAAIVLEQYGAAYGVFDVWGAEPAALAERARYHGSGLHAGDFAPAIAALTHGTHFQESVTVKCSARVVDASFANETWTVVAEGDTYRGKALVVAQPPWQAAMWLPRPLWPASLLQVASKTKPVSIVVLAETLTRAAPEDLPDVLVVPAEGVQIVRNGPSDIAFQATIDYELSLSAPAVVKAVRSLKRARKKLLALYPGLISEGNRIALVPVAWAQSPAHADKRWLNRLDKKAFNTPVLSFCGDAYGARYDGDSNLLRSLITACDAVGKGIVVPSPTPSPSPEA